MTDNSISLDADTETHMTNPLIAPMTATVDCILDDERGQAFFFDHISMYRVQVEAIDVDTGDSRWKGYAEWADGDRIADAMLEARNNAKLNAAAAW